MILVIGQVSLLSYFKKISRYNYCSCCFLFTQLAESWKEKIKVFVVIPFSDEEM